MTDTISIGLGLLMRPDFEGLRHCPYLCPAGYWTIGIGNRCLADGSPVTAKTAPITSQEAIALARVTLGDLHRKLAGWIGRPLLPHQEGALLSWQYNIGSTAARDSTLMSFVRAGKMAEAAAQFPRWDRATVDGRLKVLPGLTKRRAIEQRVFLGRATPDVWLGPAPAPPSKPTPLSPADRLNAAELARVKA